MEQIDLSYKIELEENKIIKNIAIADQKDIFEKADEIIVKGKLFLDIFCDDESCNHQNIDFSITLNKRKYHLKDINLKLDDYNFEQIDNICNLTIFYKVNGEDVSLENFCLFDNDELSNELKDYLTRSSTSLSQIDIDEDKIIILDPVIEEEPIKVECEPENFTETKKETSILDENRNSKKDELFKETYVSSFMFYRIKNNETIDDIAHKFNIKKEKLISFNNDKEFKVNALIQIPHND